MPPVIKTTKEQIINEAIELVEERGFEALTARSLAERLKISTQPIYREFKDMESLKTAALEKGFEIYLNEAKSCEGALSQAVAYVRFAVRRGNLFNFLFRSKSCEYHSLEHMSHSILKDGNIISLLQELTHLENEQVYKLHFYIWMAIHGLCDIAANNKTTFSDREIEEFVKTLSSALTVYFKEEK